MNGNKVIPREKWLKEYAKLRERFELEAVRIYKLSDEIKAVKRILRSSTKREKN
jgi:hypothetical protein